MAGAVRRRKFASMDRTGQPIEFQRQGSGAESQFTPAAQRPSIKPAIITISASTTRGRSTPARLRNIASSHKSIPRRPTNIRINNDRSRRRRCRLLLLLAADPFGLKAAMAKCFTDSAYNAVTTPASASRPRPNPRRAAPARSRSAGTRNGCGRRRLSRAAPLRRPTPLLVLRAYPRPTRADRG